MRFVPAKTADQQAALLLASERERLVRARTQLVNAIRGHAAEFGLVEAKGVGRAGALLEAVAADAGVPVMAREVFAELAEELAALELRLAAADQKLRAWHRASEVSQKLLAIPGIGPVGASLLAMKVPDPHAFKSGRDFAAWLGLTPKDHSTAGKARPGGITRAGDEALRSVLVVGATAVIRQMRPPAPLKPGQPKPGRAGQGQAGTAPAEAGRTGRGHARARPAPAGPRPWLARLLERKAPKLAAVALANKTARIAWKLMATGGTCDPSHGRSGAACAAAGAPAAA